MSQLWSRRQVPVRRGERGQALAETAIFSLLAVLLGFALLSLIPIHRVRTAATAAAYGCAQFASQSPNPSWAVWQAEQVAWQTLEAGWSGASGAQFQVEVLAPSGPGSSAGCVVFYRPPILFGTLLGSGDPVWSAEWFVSQAETWKGQWR